MQEGAGEDAPPLAVGDRRAVDGARLDQRPAASDDGEPLTPVSTASTTKTTTLAAMIAQVTQGGVGGVAPRARLNWRRAAKSWPVSFSSQAMRLAIAPRSCGRGAPIGLAVGVDRLLEVAVADLLLGDRAPAQPGIDPPRSAACCQACERAGLVVEAVAGRADRQPRGPASSGSGWPVSGARMVTAASRSPRVEEALPLGEALPRFIGHSAGALSRKRNDRREIGTSAVVSRPPGGERGRPGVRPGPASMGAGYFARRRKSSTSS